MGLVGKNFLCKCISEYSNINNNAKYDCVWTAHNGHCGTLSI